MMRTAVFSVLVLLGCSGEKPAKGEGGSPEDFFQIRLEIMTADTSAFALRLPQTGERVAFDDTVRLNLREVSRAVVRPSFREGDFIVVAELSDFGAEKFTRLTSEHLNRRVGVILGGELSHAPFIMERIRSGSTPVMFGLAQVEADSLAALLNQKLAVLAAE